MIEISTDVFTIVSKKDYENLEAFREDEKISKKLFNKLYRSDRILINGTLAAKHKRVNKNDQVTLLLEEYESNNIKREEMELSIVYEDMDIIIIDKPPYMPVHTTRYHQEATLSNGIAYYFYKNNINKKIRIVNRLDKDTSGIMVIAKTQHIDHQLSMQFRERTVKKKYLAIVEGVVKDNSGLIEEKILKLESSKKIIDEKGKDALTYYKVLKRFEDKTLLEVEIFTGRSHQIRLHLSHIGHPILGDFLYGSKIKLDRYALHSNSLLFYHPRLQKLMEFSSPLPSDLKSIIC